MSNAIRTDLAMEARERLGRRSVPGLKSETLAPQEGVTLTRVAVGSDEAAQAIQKAKGRYVTLEAPGLALRDPLLEEAVSHLMAQELSRMMPEPAHSGPVMVVGLGNWNITPDSLGPRVVKRTMVTRHLLEMIPQAVDRRVRPVCAMAPGVLGVTGIETVEVVKGVASRVHPAAVVAVDALASRDSRRIATTLQLSDAGIQPGSGVGNRRLALNGETLGCPVVAIGVPTVVYATTIIRDALEKLGGGRGALGLDVETAMDQMRSDSLSEMVVTPKEVDVLVEDTARWLSMGLNLWIHNGLSAQEVETFLH